MAQTNKVITDSSGNEITYYGCATVSDACELGGVAPDADMGNHLVVVDDVINNNTYNVTLADETKIEYSSNSQAVAYDDLVVCEAIKTPMYKPLNQKLGVLLLNSSLVASPLSTFGTGEASDYLTYSSLQLGRVRINKSKTTIIPAYIRVMLQSMTNSYIDGSAMQGYEIVLQNFITDLYDGSSLKIKKVSLKDCIISDEFSSTSIYNSSVDASAFNITDTTQSRAVVENGSQILCSMIKQNATDTKYSKYTDFDNTTPQTLSLMILYANGSISPLYADQLMSSIDIEFEYLKYNEDKTTSFTAVSTMSFELWTEYTLQEIAPKSVELEVLDDGSLPEVEDDESGETQTIDPARTILYTTNRGMALSGYTDAFASAFAGGAAVVNSGYATLSDGTHCGWIQYADVPQEVGCNTLFSSNANILTTVTIPNGVTKISEKAFYKCSNLYSVIIPPTVSEIGKDAFYWSGLTELTLNSQELTLNAYCFSECHKLKELTIGEGTILIWDGVFRNCSNLTYVRFPSNKGQLYPLGAMCFSNCTSLKTNLLKYTWAKHSIYRDKIGDQAFFNCSALTTISLNGLCTWMADLHANQDCETFKFCSNLKNIIIRDKVEYYDNGDVYDYQYSVTKAGFRSSTFETCVNVENIYCESQHPPYLGIKNIWKRNAINPKTCQLYIPTGRTAAYRTKAQWGDFPKENIHELTSEEFQDVYETLLWSQD